jgi:hypothetical protein
MVIEISSRCRHRKMPRADRNWLAVAVLPNLCCYGASVYPDHVGNKVTIGRVIVFWSVYGVAARPG